VDTTGDVIPQKLLKVRRIVSVLGARDEDADDIPPLDYTINSLTDGGSADDPGNIWVKGVVSSSDEVVILLLCK
jgi:hypothetical protein